MACKKKNLSLGPSPLQALEIGPRSGPYHMDQFIIKVGNLRHSHLSFVHLKVFQTKLKLLAEGWHASQHIYYMVPDSFNWQRRLKCHYNTIGLKQGFDQSLYWPFSRIEQGVFFFFFLSWCSKRDLLDLVWWFPDIISKVLYLPLLLFLFKLYHLTLTFSCELLVLQFRFCCRTNSGWPRSIQDLLQPIARQQCVLGIWTLSFKIQYTVLVNQPLYPTKGSMLPGTPSVQAAN